MEGRMRLKVEISRIRGHRRRVLLSFEAETPEEAIHRISRFLLEKFPETYEKIYGVPVYSTKTKEASEARAAKDLLKVEEF